MANKENELKIKDKRLEKQIEMDCFLEEEIEQLKNAEKEAERYIYVCNKRIKEYQEKLKKAENRLLSVKDNIKNKITFTLNSAFENGEISCGLQETLTQTTYLIPSAKFIFKKEKNKIVKKDDEKLIKYFEEKKMNEFIKTELKQSPKWKEFKSTLNVSDDGELIDSDGVICKIDGIEIEKDDAELEIKLI